MCNSNAKKKYLSNSLKHNVLDQDFGNIIDIAGKTKENITYKRKHIYTQNLKT